MLPTIDTYTLGIGGGVPPHPEPERPVRRPEEETPVSAVERKTEAGEQTGPAKAAKRETEVIPARREDQDRVELNFHLTREEREAFATAFSSKQNPETMSPDEQETLKKASERISKYIEEAVTRNSDSRERVEKAVGEWYSRLTRGEQSPFDLINLLRQAAMGNLDEFGK